jgi:hypothetical protein
MTDPSSQLFLYDPDFDAATVQPNGQGQVRLSQVQGISRVRLSIVNNNRITINHVVILDQPADGLAADCNFNFTGAQGRQCVPRSLAWLWKIVEDTANGYEDAIQGGGGAPGEHGCVVPADQLAGGWDTVMPTLALYGWRELHL